MYSSYQKIIDDNLKINHKEWYFKRDPHYKEILEHVSYEQGNKYLELIKNKYCIFFQTNKNFIIEICNLNDLYGDTQKNQYIDFCNTSPSNLRYIFHSLLILEHMNKKTLNNIDIIEIGGGYGGLCLFLYKLSPLFNLTINSYTIFDLPEAMKLQEKYLNLHNINIETISLFDNFNLNKNSFLISNYAFSEISMDLQKIYKEKVLNPYVNNGFMSWNCCDIYDFIDNKIITFEREYPLTGNKNYYVYF